MASSTLLLGLTIPLPTSYDAPLDLDSPEPEPQAPPRQRPQRLQIDWYDLLPPPDSQFMSLPPELRRMIFRYIMVVGTVEPFGVNMDEKSQTPCMALLRASKLLHLIAEPLLYENIFRFATLEAVKSFFCIACGDGGRQMKVKKVEIAFQRVPIEVSQWERLVDLAYERKLDDDLEGLGTERGVRVSKHIHYLSKEYYRDQLWRPMANLILGTFQPQQLNIDLREAKDETRCCWLQTTALLCLSGGFTGSHMPQKLRVIGCLGFEKEPPYATTADSLVHALLQIWTAGQGEQGAIPNEPWTQLLKEDVEKILKKEARAEQNHNDDRIENQ